MRAAARSAGDLNGGGYIARLYHVKIDPLCVSSPITTCTRKDIGCSVTRRRCCNPGPIMRARSASLKSRSPITIGITKELISMKSKNCAKENPDLKIRAGIELDNDPQTSAAGRKWVEKNWDRLDFVLGSVHYLERDDQMFDSVPAGAAQFADRDIDAIYADYFRRVREVAATGLVDCLAHLDLIKIHGHRPNTDIESLAAETLDFIRSRNLAIELSTAGWRKPVKELYPSDRIIELALARGIPFTTASDAHSHVQLGENYERLEEKMNSLGVRAVCTFQRHKRTAVSL